MNIFVELAFLKYYYRVPETFFLKSYFAYLQYKMLSINVNVFCSLCIDVKYSIKA